MKNKRDLYRDYRKITGVKLKSDIEREPNSLCGIHWE